MKALILLLSMIQLSTYAQQGNIKTSKVSVPACYQDAQSAAWSALNQVKALSIKECGGLNNTSTISMKYSPAACGGLAIVHKFQCVKTTQGLKKLNVQIFTYAGTLESLVGSLNYQLEQDAKRLCAGKNGIEIYNPVVEIFSGARPDRDLAGRLEFNRKNADLWFNMYPRAILEARYKCI